MEYQLFALSLHMAPDPLGSNAAFALCQVHLSLSARSAAVHDAETQVLVAQPASAVGVGGETLLAALIGQVELDPGGTTPL